MPEPFPKLEFVEGYIPITPPQLTSLGGIPRNEPELPDPADSNGSAQDHADAVRESDYRNDESWRIFGHPASCKEYRIYRALKEADAYIAHLQHTHGETVAVPSIITDAIKLAEGR